MNLNDLAQVLQASLEQENAILDPADAGALAEMLFSEIVEFVKQSPYPRPPLPGEDLVGKICCCGTGRVAIVTGEGGFTWGHAWTGLGLDGKGTWASSNPMVLADDPQMYHNKLLERFGGKLSFNN